MDTREYDAFSEIISKDVLSQTNEKYLQGPAAMDVPDPFSYGMSIDSWSGLSCFQYPSEKQTRSRWAFESRAKLPLLK